MVTLHVSVWVEIVVDLFAKAIADVTLHVSVWVEIFKTGSKGESRAGHAPRERVSWNFN